MDHLETEARNPASTNLDELTTLELVRLMNAEGAVVVVLKSEIEERARGRSAMPEDLVKKLSLFDLRDLVAFLAELK